MLLSEGFKDRIMKLAGIPAGQNLISEVDKRGVIIKNIKFPTTLSKEIADWAHNLSEKYSIWIADSFRKFLIHNRIIDEKGNVLGAMPDEEGKIEVNKRRVIDDEIRTMVRGLTGDYNYILDWLKGRNTLAPEHDQLNFKTLTLQDAKKRSEEWHKNLAAIKGGKIEGEEGEVVMTFPEGFYWIKIGKDYCPKEAEAMGHCGRASGTVLYSLRREQYPFVTAAVKEETGAVTQMKGRANTKPKAQFHKYIIPFILGNNPDIKYFKSTYAANTDFNIADLSDSELKQVVDKKPSLLMGDGAIAIKKLSEQEISKLLVEHPEVFEGSDATIFLSDILRNENMVDWAIAHAPKLFHAHNWGTVKFNENQLYKALNNKIISGYLHIDEMSLDETALNWIVKNRPEMFETSSEVIRKLSDEQKDYLVKNHPKAFTTLFGNLEVGNSTADKTVYETLGKERLTKLFISNPGLFNRGRISYSFYGEFLTPELLESYIKNHNTENDPLNILGGEQSSTKRLSEINHFMNMNTAFYLLKHYPKEFYASATISFANKEGGEILGKYIIDHHYEWLWDYIVRHRSKLNIQHWNLSPAQKQKIVNSDIEGDTEILINYDEQEIRELHLSPVQIQELLNSENFTQYLTIDLIKGFGLTPDKEQTKQAIFKVLGNDEDKIIKVLEEVAEMYGEEYVHSLYNSNPEAINALVYAVKYKDVNRLKKYNTPEVSYTKSGIKLRFSDWSDDELIDLFKETETAKKVANNDLELWGNYDYKFNDISNDFDDLDQINIARTRFLLGKAFPAKFKKTIQAMKISELVGIMEDPDSISEEPVEYEDTIIEGIKEAFERAMDDAQLSADESEYWNLYIKPIKKLFGDSKFVNVKTKKKGEEEIKTVQMLEFEISYGEFEEFLKAAQENADYNYGDEVIDVNHYAKQVIRIIQSALEENNEKLEIDEPYYGVHGDINKEDLNERFGERLFEESDLSSMLNKARIVVKNKKQ